MEKKRDRKRVSGLSRQTKSHRRKNYFSPATTLQPLKIILGATEIAIDGRFVAEHSVESVAVREGVLVVRQLHRVPDSKKLPQAANGNGNGGRTVRDRLCHVIRQHQLDPNLVKSYAIDFCGVKTLRDATRDQVENFIVHLADWAEKDRNALLCQLNSYPGQKEGAA